MANQHTKAAADAAAIAGAPSPAPDAPDLTPDPEPTVQLTQTQLDDMLARVAEDAAERATRAAARTVNTFNAGAQLETFQAAVVLPEVEPPTEPTYEPGEVDEDGVAYAATIQCRGPKGDLAEVTPKVFRTIMAAKGYVAHPSDAQQHQGNEPRRSRRSERAANLDGTDPEQVSAPRRRRRAAAAAD